MSWGHREYNISFTSILQCLININVMNIFKYLFSLCIWLQLSYIDYGFSYSTPFWSQVLVFFLFVYLFFHMSLKVISKHCKHISSLTSFWQVKLLEVLRSFLADNFFPLTIFVGFFLSTLFRFQFHVEDLETRILQNTDINPYIGMQPIFLILFIAWPVFTCKISYDLFCHNIKKTLRKDFSEMDASNYILKSISTSLVWF